MNWCAFFRHRPLKVAEAMFSDSVSGATVRRATCRCGIEWMTDGGRWVGFKMRRGNDDAGSLGRAMADEINRLWDYDG